MVKPMISFKVHANQLWTKQHKETPTGDFMKDLLAVKSERPTGSQTSGFQSVVPQRATSALLRNLLKCKFSKINIVGLGLLSLEGIACKVGPCWVWKLDFRRGSPTP